MIDRITKVKVFTELEVNNFTLNLLSCIFKKILNNE